MRILTTCLLPVLALANAAFAQSSSFVSPAIAIPAARGHVNAPNSLLWVHAGVTAQLAGTFGDWATSWKQPEGNGMLAQSGGRYAGKFYRSGTAAKFGLAAGVTAISYAIAWKWPRTRKLVGVFNMTMGAGLAAQGVRNAIANPYYKP